MTDPESPSRTMNGPLLIALVSLAVIGASVGVIVGLMNAGAKQTLDGSQAQGGTTVATGSASGTPVVVQTPNAEQGTITPAKPTYQPTGKRCLEHTEKLAGRPLTQVMYVRARNGSDWIESWICRDSAGKLYYQGHDGTPDDRVLVEGDDALFLAEGVQAANGGYQAYNKDTRYLVTRNRVYIGGTSYEVTHREE